MGLDELKDAINETLYEHYGRANLCAEVVRLGPKQLEIFLEPVFAKCVDCSSVEMTMESGATAEDIADEVLVTLLNDEDDEEAETEEIHETERKGKKPMRLKTEALQESVKAGLKVGSAKKATKTLIAAVKKGLGKNYPKFFSTPLGKRLEPFVIPVLVSVLAETYGGEKFEKVANFASYAVEGFVADEAESILSLLDPLLNDLLAVVPEVA